MGNLHPRLAWTIPLFVALPLAAAPQVLGQARAPQGSAQPAATTTGAEGIPVTDPDVVRACGGCHVPDDKQRMTRISYRRATPENWELTIRRMISLNNAQITPETARHVIKSLSDSHGLAPEEARPVMFEAERRLIDFTYEGDKETHELCSTCHSIGRALSERRSKDEWNGLIAMHRYFYPGIDGSSGGFRRRDRTRGQGGNGDSSDGEYPVDRALNHLVKALPLGSQEWTEWSAVMRSPKLAGRWALAGYQIGKGPLYGEVNIADGPDLADSFTTEGRFVYAKSGQTVQRRSRAIVYTGFQWRGRSADGPDDPGTWREVAFIERDGQEIRGRWFTGAYDETGIDVTLRRVLSSPVVSGTDVLSLRSSSANQRIRIYGANLPQTVDAADIDFGQGVRVARVVGTAPDMITVDVDVAQDARVGRRDLTIGGATRPAALTIYAQVGAIKVLPQAGMARLGGISVPMRAEQFEARGVGSGADGKLGTADDLDLGPVDVSWSIEEYAATFADDDAKFVGEIGQDGLFTPNVEGPNPNRSGNRNNVGDVWVVASYQRPGAAPSEKAMRARAHLLVTVPLYIEWGPKELGKP